MGKYFGTDGFRGEANVNLTADHAFKVGRFLGWYYGELKKRNGDDTPARIVIGKDTRRSSYMFEYSLVGGLVASGADAYLLHVTTTPSVAYGVHENVSDPVKMYQADICTVTVNIASLPAISTPCGYNADGMPIGMSIVGKQFDEATILQVADAFEQQFQTAVPVLK